jgi:hypothetical protein
MTLYKDIIEREATNKEINEKILSAYDKMLLEDATKKAHGTLKAIMNMFKDKEDNEIYKMAKGMEKSYEKNKGFSKDQAKWIYNTAKALFKK